VVILIPVLQLVVGSQSDVVASNQKVLICTTNIKKIIANLYYFILRRKITDKQ